jgi:hypothetical protein
MLESVMEPLAALDTALTGTFRRPDSPAARPAPARHGAQREHEDIESGLRYSRSDGISLYVQTRQGDIVRLRVKSDQSLSAWAPEPDHGDRVVAETTVSARTATRVSLSLKGSLNTDELAALSALFERVGALAETFRSGDLPSLFAEARALELDAEQLAAVALKRRSSTRLTYAAPAARASTSTPPVSEVPLAGARAQAAARGSETVGDVTVAESVAPSDALRARSDDARYSFRAITDFLTRLIDDLERFESPAPANGDGRAPSIDTSVKLKLFASIVVTLSEADAPGAGGAPSPAPDLLPNVIDSIAEQSEHLDALA